MTLAIIRGRSHPPPRIGIYGPSGVGKSTLACTAEHNAPPAKKVIALDGENGLEHIGVDRVKLEKDWPATLRVLGEMCTAPGAWEAVVVDTIDKLADQAEAQVIADNPKTSKGKPVTCLADYGWGDGFEMLAAKWKELLFVLERAREHGRWIILVGHIARITEDDPVLGGRTTRHVAAIDKRCWAITHRWLDGVFFARYEAGLAESRAVLTGERELHTVAGTGFDAKNRWGLPPKLPLSWRAFQEAYEASLQDVEVMQAAIRQLAQDKEKAEQFIREASGDSLRLAKMVQTLKTKAVAG